MNLMAHATDKDRDSAAPPASCKGGKLDAITGLFTGWIIAKFSHRYARPSLPMTPAAPMDNAKLLRYAEKNPPPQEWYDEDVDPFEPQR